MGNKLVYLAGPLFSEADRWFVSQLTDRLAAAAGLDPVRDFFLPHRDSPELCNSTPTDVFNVDIEQLALAPLVVACLDGPDVDSGTAFEIGYAHACGKKVFGIVTDFRAASGAGLAAQRPNLMIWAACEHGVTLHHTVTGLVNDFRQYAERSGRGKGR